MHGSWFWTETDAPVLWSGLEKISKLCAGAVTIWLVATRFTPEVQGYFFTFFSLLALQVFVDLGVAGVVVPFASHEWAGLGLDERRRIVGDPQALSRLVSFGRMVFGWFLASGAISAAGLGVFGYFFFSAHAESVVAWQTPWLMFCVIGGLNLCLSPVWTLLEGCNQVSAAYFARFLSSVLGSVLLWWAILSGAGLFSAAIPYAVSILAGLGLAVGRYPAFFRAFCAPPAGRRMSWSDEVWPMQWRIGLSWLSGYFINWFFTPVLFHFHGAAVAGRFGMTWTAGMAIFGIASSWLNTRAPQFGVLIAQRDFSALDHRFFRAAGMSLWAVLSGSALFAVLIYVLGAARHPLADRLLSLRPTVLMLLAIILTTVSYAQAVYLRCHKQEPAFWLSILQGIFTGLSTWVLGSRYGPTGVAAGYLAVVALLVIPAGTIVWLNKRRVWHTL